MMIRYNHLFTFLFLIVTINVFGQTDSLNHYEFERNLIDSLTDIIDKHNPPKKKLAFTTTLDSLVGEQIMTIENQKFKKLSKYSLRTIKTGTGMNVKFVELYLFNDTIIKAKVFYNMDKNDFWKMYYYKDNTYFFMIATPRCIPISIDENGEEYVGMAKKLVAIEQVPISRKQKRSGAGAR